MKKCVPVRLIVVVWVLDWEVGPSFSSTGLQRRSQTTERWVLDPLPSQVSIGLDIAPRT